MGLAGDSGAIKDLVTNHVLCAKKCVICSEYSLKRMKVIRLKNTVTLQTFFWYPIFGKKGVKQHWFLLNLLDLCLI